MTPEEKARAYDEALERAKMILCNIPEGSASVRDIETIFPELRESEDERIRKEIIECIETLIKAPGANPRLCDWLSWLEKQKEQEGLDRMTPIYNDKESFETALEKAWKYYDESGARTVDSCEDDYIECVFAKGFREGFLCGKQKEHKPVEWSEEDEEMRLEAIRVLVSGCERYRKESGCLPGWHKVIDWLKSLRPSWKPSEDEERLINTSISFLKDFADKGYENAVECIDWLKSKLNGNTGK